MTGPEGYKAEKVPEEEPIAPPEEVEVKKRTLLGDTAEVWKKITTEKNPQGF